MRFVRLDGITQFSGGQLEIDLNRGVLYFHAEAGYTVLRICGLDKERLKCINEELGSIDVTLRGDKGYVQYCGEPLPKEAAECHYCENKATKKVVWLKDKNGNPARIALPWCGCDLMEALTHFWGQPYQIVEGIDFIVE